MLELRPFHSAAPRRTALSWSPRTWLAVSVAVVVVAIAWVSWTRMRPEYDAFGWLVWGHQLLHWNLNTQGAPSWKPLTFVFTLPYALAGANPQMWLWMVTSVAAALGGVVFAGRLAYRLSLPGPPWAGICAALFAGAGVLGLEGYSHLVLISNSDPMVVTLCLAAIDAHLGERPRLAFWLLIAASLGRPEVWPFAVLYGVWLARDRDTSVRTLVCGLAVIPAAWFIVPALTSNSWLIAGDNALNSPNVIMGDKLTGVFTRLLGLIPLPLGIAVGLAVLFAIVLRQRVWLGLLAAVLLWALIEIAFALHGWSAVPRYLIEPAAVLVVLAGALVGRVLAYGAGAAGPGRWAAFAAPAVLALALLPTLRSRADITHGEIDDARRLATQISNLQNVIARAGGPAAVKACGQPVTPLEFESTLAWAISDNVIDVGYIPGRATGRGPTVVLFEPQGLGWRVEPLRVRGARQAPCAALRTAV